MPKIGEIVQAEGWRGDWEIVEIDPDTKRPYCLSQPEEPYYEGMWGGFNDFPPPVLIWVKENTIVQAGQAVEDVQ